MKKLDVVQMEGLQGGTMATCGQAVVMGAMMGGMFGGVGAVIGGFAVIAFSQNCNP